ncbi:hypothetical protein, partial [Cellvibrio sp.]
ADEKMISASVFAVFSYLKRIGSSMDSGVFSETIARRDAGNEPPWMGSRRVSEKTPESMRRGHSKN